jgi:hypothetical protein
MLVKRNITANDTKSIVRFHAPDKAEFEIDHVDTY